MRMRRTGREKKMPGTIKIVDGATKQTLHCISVEPARRPQTVLGTPIKDWICFLSEGGAYWARIVDERFIGKICTLEVTDIQRVS